MKCIWLHVYIIIQNIKKTADIFCCHTFLLVIVSRKEPEVTFEAMTNRFVMYSFAQEIIAGK